MIELNSNDIHFIVVTSSALLLVLAGFFFAFIHLYRQRQQMFRKEQEQREHEYSRELIRSQLEIKEEMMQKLSREIHDNIGQSLVVAKLQLSSVIQEQNLDHAATVEELLSRSISDLRNLSKTLNGEYILKEGINDAIEKEVKIINQLKSIDCEMIGTFPKHFISPDSEIIVFRCIQEILSNCIKHSGAQQVKVHISKNENQLTIDVSDNGKGMSEDWEKNKGLGIDNIRKRVELLNGKLTISIPDGGGTKFSIILSETNRQQIEYSDYRHSR